MPKAEQARATTCSSDRSTRTLARAGCVQRHDPDPIVLRTLFHTEPCPMRAIPVPVIYPLSLFVSLCVCVLCVCEYFLRSFLCPPRDPYRDTGRDLISSLARHCVTLAYGREQVGLAHSLEQPPPLPPTTTTTTRTQCQCQCQALASRCAVGVAS